MYKMDLIINNNTWRNEILNSNSSKITYIYKDAYYIIYALSSFIDIE